MIKSKTLTKHRREVTTEATTEEATKIAKDYHMFYIEISAKTGQNVQAANFNKRVDA